MVETAPAREHQRDAVIGRGGDALLPQCGGIFVAVVEIASQRDAAQRGGVVGSLLENGTEVDLGGDGVPGHGAHQELAEREHRAVVGELAGGRRAAGACGASSIGAAPPRAATCATSAEIASKLAKKHSSNAASARERRRAAA